MKALVYLLANPHRAIAIRTLESLNISVTASGDYVSAIEHLMSDQTDFDLIIIQFSSNIMGDDASDLLRTASGTPTLPSSSLCLRVQT